MKKGLKIFGPIALLAFCTPVLASCGEQPGTSDVFSFTARLESGKTVISNGASDKVIISGDLTNRNFEFTILTPENIEWVNEAEHTFIATATGEASIKVKETTSRKTVYVNFDIIDNVSTRATGGFNYTSANTKESVQKRTEILGELEKYAIDKHLTGITLFENGGTVKYSKRTVIPAPNYVTGYGFGILTEGSLNGVLPGDPSSEYSSFYHTAQTNNTNDINAWNATGSQISDLSSYISSSYWGTRMTSTKDGYEWYPLLAADTCKVLSGGSWTEKVNDRPVPVGKANDLGLYKTWKIYVKTDENMGAKGFKFHTTNTGKNSKEQPFNGLGVTLADYEFAYRLLLTGSNQQSRGAEMAGDKTYGIKGANTYYSRTKNSNDAQAKAIWDAMTTVNAQGIRQLGIATGTDNGGDYIELELINAIDDFTAMYTLSSSLVSPMNEEFIKSICPDQTSESKIRDGVAVYGKNTGASTEEIQNGNIIPSRTLACAPYMLKKWTNDIIFVRNDDWFEYDPDSRYKIPGIKITTYDSYSQDQLWNLFEDGDLDSVGVPVSKIESAKTDEKGTIKKTEGDSTFKLNINSCTQERWDELFGDKPESSNLDPAWGGIKPWMSNDSFLKGLYWSIDRETFATKRGYQPSINYFSNSYLSDPAGVTRDDHKAISYNSTPEHKKAIKNYHDDEIPVYDDQGNQIGTKDNYGFDLKKARDYFRLAIDELKGTPGFRIGTKDDPFIMKVAIKWMYTTDVTEYGTEIANYLESAFNDDSVCGGKVKLQITQSAVTNWENVYNKIMMVGQFDLAFGAISGNTYNPLNFMEVLKSDNSSTFTLNWGPDTSKIDENSPIVYEDKAWSYDALWECANYGGVVNEGEPVPTVKQYHIAGTKFFDSLEQGGELDFNLEFVDVPKVTFTIDRVEIYVSGGQNTSVTSWEQSDDKKTLSITISKELGEQITQEINEIVNKNKQDGDQGYVKELFVASKYMLYFSFEVYYSINIEGYDPSQSMVTIVSSAEDQLVK